MANLNFALRLSLGLITGTDKIESEKNALISDFNKLSEYKESEELKEFEELDKLVNSNDFINKKKEIIALNYKNTEEYSKEKKYVKLKKDKRIVNYFKVAESNEYKTYLETLSSDILKEYLEIKEQIASDNHISIKSKLKNELNNELKKEKEYKKLKKSKEIKNYFKFINLSDYSTYLELKDTEEVKKYSELETFVKSDTLKEFKKELKIRNKTDKENKINYSDTDEAKKEAEFASLKQDGKFKIYFKFSKSSKLELINRVKDSQELVHFQELESYITNPEFKLALESLKYENSDAFKLEQRFKESDNSQQIKFWKSFKKSKKYILFEEIKDSTLLKEYEDLDEFTKSQDFIELKAYMLDKDKYSKTEEAEKEIRYKELKKSDNIIWYNKNKDSNRFNSLHKWNLTFEDDFENRKIDESKWMNSFFWGKMLIDDRYVMAGDKHFYTDNKNIEISNSEIKLITKNEKIEGRIWHPTHGFYKDNFDYTSAMLSSAHSFRQKYGKFEAKVKLDGEFPVFQAFWLKGEKIVPEIDVFNFNIKKRNKLFLTNHWGDNSNNTQNSLSSKINGSPLTKNYFIYTLEWTDTEIVWYINGLEVYKTTQNIPNEPMYLLFSSGLQLDPKGENINSEFKIDWIRCYEKIDG